MKSNKLVREESVMLERKGRKEHLPIWTAAAEMLAAPKSSETVVNINRLSRIADGKNPLLVPGKVLGSGVLDKTIVVGAFSFSESARKKIESAGGHALAIEEFVRKYPKGSGVVIVR